MNKQPKVSVVMPTYNAETYLREAIDSILSQTFQDFELLIIDDNSKDKTREIIKSYEDNRVRLIDGPCRGISAALNVGLKEAKGKYIARMDADDISLPERFANQVKFMDEHPEVGVCAIKAEYFGDKVGQQYGDWWSRNHEADYIKCGILDFVNTCPICHPSTMFNNELFKRFDLWYNEEYKAGEDQELWSRACLLFDIYVINKVLLHYRWYGNNASTVRTEGKMLSQQAREILLKKLMPQYRNFTQDYWYFESETHKINDAIMNMGKEARENNALAYQEKNIRKKKIKLFSFIPFYSRVVKKQRQTFKIFGIPVFTIKKSANGNKSKYYCLGIPVLKILIK